MTQAQVKFYKSITEALEELRMIAERLQKLDLSDSKKAEETLADTAAEITQVVLGIQRLIEWYAFAGRRTYQRKYYKGKKT